MLSRIAESLFWIGRYLERAEDCARLLDVHLQLGVEDPVADPAVASAHLLAVMGVDTDAPPSQELVMRLLCHDPDSSSSVVSAITGARESARRARETVPTEMWESINTTWHAIHDGELRRQRPSSAFRFVRERCAVITATADTTMSHDQGWHFLVLGRCLERVDMTARLVVAASLSSSPVAWSTALRACGAHHAFILGSHDPDSARAAAEFLLLDRLFPRSVVHSLDRAIDALERLDGSERRGAYESEPARLLGRARAELEFRTRGEILVDLPDRMSALQGTCSAANDAIAELYFEGATAAEWHEGAV